MGSVLQWSISLEQNRSECQGIGVRTGRWVGTWLAMEASVERRVHSHHLYIREVMAGMHVPNMLIQGLVL